MWFSDGRAATGCDVLHIGGSVGWG